MKDHFERPKLRFYYTKLYRDHIQAMLSKSNTNPELKVSETGLETAAKNDNPIAAADLGVFYKYGKGCKLNFNKARHWFEKASENGNSKNKASLLINQTRW